MEKILVTGANGFVGFYIVKHLLNHHFHVIATGKGASRLPFTSGQLEYTSLDFTNNNEVEKILNHHKPDIIIHSGAVSKPDECEQNREAAYLTNVTGTIYLKAAAEKIGCFFIFLSTDFVFDGTKGMYKEEDRTDPVNYYGITKQLAEEQVMNHSNNWSIVRTVLVYGRPFLNRQNLLTNTAISLRKKDRLKIFHDQVRTPTYVEDLAKAITVIAKTKSSGIFHISGNDILTPFEMAVATAEYLGLDKTLITPVTEKEFEQPARRPLKTGFDISKAKKELGYQPVSFREGLKLTFE